jgi:hypothetical protein
VDLSITPLTNTLPIRRLKLGVGESAEIATAYVAIPDMEASLDRQRYTRVAFDRYRYVPLDSDFVSRNARGPAWSCDYVSRTLSAD